jgi:HK97 family phage major capsid protein
MSRQLITTLLERRGVLTEELDKVLQVPNAENRNLTDAEAAEFERIKADIVASDARIAELAEIDTRDEAAAEIARKYAPSGIQVLSEPQVYRRKTPDTSYFRDLYRARQHGDRDAYDRLERNNKMVADAKAKAEERAISTSNAAGGEFVPPLWLEEDFVKLARAGRITANLCRQGEVPPGTDSINIPKINTGTAVAVQATQNTGVQNTDLTTTSVSSPVITVAGGQTVSLQLIEQSPLNIDEIILGDLAADYAVKLNAQVLSGSGSSGQATGILTLSGTNAVTWTQATPSLAGPGSLYPKAANGLALVHTRRFMPPTAIVMHPLRWAWAECQVDNNGRPLVVPASGGVFQMIANLDHQVSQGLVGQMLGLPVYADAVIPVNGGTGANQDSIIISKFDDLWLWEGQVRAEAFAQTYANQMSVFVRLYNYVSFQAGRYAPSTSVITGTGATSPVF